MSPLIIIDRKRKRKDSDYDWTDAMGVEAAKRAKEHQIQVDIRSDCLIDKFICKYGDHKFLMGRRIWAKKDKSDIVFEGCVVDIYPARYILIRDVKTQDNIPIKFENVIEIKGEDNGTRENA